MTSLAVQQPEGSGAALALALCTPAEAKTAMRQYQEMCEAVLEPSDYQEFPQKKKVGDRWVTESRKFKKKSAVKKLQTFWGVTVQIKSTTREDLPDGHYAWTVIATASHRNGRIVEATGACSTFEERFDLTQNDRESDTAFAARQRKALARAYHDVLATAETRATNRAVMNCIGVGGGEVTADEISTERNVTPRAQQQQQQPPPANAAPPSTQTETPAARPSAAHVTNGGQAEQMQRDRDAEQLQKGLAAVKRSAAAAGMSDEQLDVMSLREFAVLPAQLNFNQQRELWQKITALAETPL